MKKGFAEIMIVFILCIVGILVVTAWESRLFTSIHRMRALTDILRATYGSETIINDAIAKFLFIGDFSQIKSGTQVLEDGTSITTKLSSKDNVDTFSVFAKRLFATTNIILTKTKNSSTEGGIRSLETILITDCTSSMSDPANSSCERTCGQYTSTNHDYMRCLNSHNCTTRMHELKKAALEFVDKLIEFQANNPSKTVKLGWNIFRVNAATVNEPTENLTLIRDKINNGLSDLQQTSSVCDLAYNSTSIGSGLDLANKYFSDNIPDSKTKRFEVLVSDGEPNSRHASYTGICGNQECNLCNPITPALDFMKCALKTRLEEGSRPNDVNTYTVTVLDNVSDNVKSILNTYSTKYFNQGDATQLTGILNNIFNEIVNTTTTINIQRVIPTPEE